MSQETSDLATADAPAPILEAERDNSARPHSPETVYVIRASARTQRKALPVFPNPACRPEGAEAPLVLEFFSSVPEGIDIALGRVPKRDTAAYLREIREAGNRSIRCEIDDAGGDGAAALEIAMALLQHRFRVSAHIVGRCSSSAIFFALAADERSIVPNGTVLIHRAARICARSQYEAMCRLSAAEKNIIDESLSHSDDVTAALLTSRLDISEETARGWMAEGRKWSASEALDHGVVNSIEEV